MQTRAQLLTWGERSYENLIFKLRAAGYEVLGYNAEAETVGTDDDHNRIMTLALGVTGCIPRNARVILKAMGIPYRQQTKLLRKIHLHALKSLYSINGVFWHIRKKQGVG